MKRIETNKLIEILTENSTERKEQKDKNQLFDLAKALKNAGYSNNLSDLTINDIDLSYMNLDRTDFTQSIISSVDFTGTNLVSSEFKFAKLLDIKMGKANLYNASLYFTELRKVIFEDSNLTKVYFCKTLLSEVDLTRANLRNTELDYRNVIIQKTYFDRAILIETISNIREIQMVQLKQARFIVEKYSLSLLQTNENPLSNLPEVISDGTKHFLRDTNEKDITWAKKMLEEKNSKKASINNEMIM